MGQDGSFCYVDQYGNARSIKVWIQGARLFVEDEFGSDSFLGKLQGAHELPLVEEK